MTFTAQKAHWQIATYTLTVITVVLFILLLAVWTSKDRQLREQYVHPCPLGRSQDGVSLINQEAGVLTDLSQEEIRTVLTFMYSMRNIPLMPPNEADLNSSFILFIELKRPEKRTVLSYLDGNGTKPTREASVMVFRGEMETASVVQYVVGELPDPTFCNMMNVTSGHRPVPYHLRPFTMYELQSLQKYVIPMLARKANPVLEESYGATLLECVTRCLTYSLTPVSSAYLESGRRKSWLSLAYKTELSYLHPVDFQVLVDTTDRVPERWIIEQIWYANQPFDSLDDFVQQFKDGFINKSRLKFPSKEELAYGSLRIGPDPYPVDGSRGPRQYEPDGHRYLVKGNSVEYMKWSFNFSVSASRGLQLFDVKFRGERIVYELSMQEIAVLYSGHSPALMYSYYADGSGLFGTMPKGLVRGYDCPEYATYLKTHMYSAKYNSPKTFPNAICIFEHSNQVPLRRHKATDHSSNFYGALTDDVLILRIVISVVHYDYVYDFIFHLNGVLEVRVSLTGYLTTSFYYPQEDFHGTRVNDHVTAGMHNHLFHFKVDLDVKGTSNRFETLDIGIENGTSPWSVEPEQKHIQTVMTRTLRETEKEAGYKYDFDSPKYLLFYNETNINKNQNPRAYRLLLRGMSKSMLPENYGFETSVPWARYQVAVTKHHDNELASTSTFAMWDARDPVVNFQKYIDDDENIVDEDLVAWVTLGTHHIPHTEDVPNTAITGNQLHFFLIPHNYFDEDPSMSVRNGVWIVPNDMKSPDAGAIVDRHGIKPIAHCLPFEQDSLADIHSNSSAIFT